MLLTERKAKAVGPERPVYKIFVTNKKKKKTKRNYFLNNPIIKGLIISIFLFICRFKRELIISILTHLVLIFPKWKKKVS